MLKQKFFKGLALSGLLFLSLYSISQALTYQEIYQAQTGQVLGASTPVVVQHKVAQTAVSGTTVAVTINSTGSGNLLVVATGNSNNRSVVSVSDGTNSFI